MFGIMNKFTIVENEFRSINDYIQRSTVIQQDTLRCVLDWNHLRHCPPVLPLEVGQLLPNLQIMLRTPVRCVRALLDPREGRSHSTWWWGLGFASPKHGYHNGWGTKFFSSIVGRKRQRVLCVYVCIYIYICVCVCVCMYVYMYVLMYVCICVYI